jgi:hypothetical protein
MHERGVCQGFGVNCGSRHRAARCTGIDVSELPFTSHGTAAERFDLPYRGCGCSTEEPNLWKLASEILIDRSISFYNNDQLHRACTDDVPVRAIILGWDAVVHRYNGLTPTWAKMRQLDELLLNKCALTERLAALRMMHLRLCSIEMGPSNLLSQVPVWYQPRPSQRQAHHPFVDLLPW